jgi:hypothetical protein
MPQWKGAETVAFRHRETVEFYEFEE